MTEGHAEQKKLDTKGYILHDSIYMAFENRQGIPWEFPGGPVVRTPHLHCRGARVGSPARELRSRKPYGVANKQTKTGKTNLC